MFVTSTTFEDGGVVVGAPTRHPTGGIGVPINYRYANGQVAPLRLLIETGGDEFDGGAPTLEAPFGLSFSLQSELEAGVRPRRNADEAMQTFRSKGGEKGTFQLQLRATDTLQSLLGRVSHAIVQKITPMAPQHFPWKPSVWRLAKEDLKLLLHDLVAMPADPEKRARYGGTVKFAVYPPRDENDTGAAFFRKGDAPMRALKWNENNEVARVLYGKRTEITKMIVCFRVWVNSTNWGITCIAHQAEFSPLASFDSSVPMWSIAPPMWMRNNRPAPNPAPRYDSDDERALLELADSVTHEDPPPKRQKGEAAVAAAAAEAATQAVQRLVQERQQQEKKKFE